VKVSPGIPQQNGVDLQQVQQVARLVLTLAGRLQDNYAAHAAEVGLTAGQSKVLMALQPGEAVPMRVLADRIRLDPSNLTGLIDKLERRYLVQRVPDAVDRRVKVLVLTEAGVGLRRAFLSLLTSSAGPLEHLSAAELSALAEALRPAVQTGEAGPGLTPVGPSATTEGSGPDAG
jgi:DNA-binding MarR family transcriptional regulator